MRRDSRLRVLVRRLPPIQAAVKNFEACVRLARMGFRTHDIDLVRKAIAVRSLSRSSLGWVTRHRTRLWEYPWALQQVDRRMRGRTQNAVDVGAGRSPVPIALSQMGLRTIVADPGNKMTCAWPGEWLWTDYSQFGIEMQRAGMEALEVERASVGFVLCISVMEHVPARVRRAGLAEFARVLEPDGVCVITLDLMRDSERLWNSALNEQVEPEGEHGSVPDLIAEASDCGLKLENMAPCPARGRRVDVMGLVFRKSAATQPGDDRGDLSAGRPAAASGDPRTSR